MRLCYAFFLLILASGAPLLGSQINASTTGLSNPAFTITFDEVAVTQNDPVTNQFADLGATFSAGTFFDPQPGFFANPSLGNFINGGNPVSPIFINFTEVQTGAAFALVTSGGTTTVFTALLNGVPVDSFSAITGTQTAFYGFAGESFDSIEFAPGGNPALFSNLQLSVAPSAPEPASIFLFGTGCGAFVLRLKRANKSLRPDVR
jgi:hypothetical protein